MRSIRSKVVSFVAGVLLGPAAVFAALESGTYISDLVATNPLGSDLASTLDDHIRLLKSTIKTTFPNINGAVTVTDEQINSVGASGVTGSANPTGTIGLSAVNGSASTYLRSDGAPALSQAISPTWTGAHSFTFSDATRLGPVITNANPGIDFIETGVTANNTVWRQVANTEQLTFQAVNDAISASGTWLAVDRTGTTVDRVAFPTDPASASRSFVVGTAPSSSNAMASIRSTSATLNALIVSGTTSGTYVLGVHGEATNHANLVKFETDASPALRGSITFGAGVVAYNTTSDERLKKNIRSAPSARSLIDCVQILSYDWKETGNHVDHGVVAQQLEKCAPYAVTKGDIWQVDKSTLIPAMIKYMQEQDVRIARLEADAARRH